MSEKADMVECAIAACKAILLYNMALNECGCDAQKAAAYRTEDGKSLDELFDLCVDLATIAVALAETHPERN